MGPVNIPLEAISKRIRPNVYQKIIRYILSFRCARRRPLSEIRRVTKSDPVIHLTISTPDAPLPHRFPLRIETSAVN
jgi:hypothetical protein